MENETPPQFTPPPLPVTANNQWWYELDGVHDGPVSKEKMKELIVNGVLKKNTIVWTVGWPKWVVANETEFLNDFNINIPPLSIKKEQNWWYEMNGEQKGPVNDNEIMKLIKNGSLNKENLIWKDGMNKWVPIRITDFNAYFRTDVPPPLTGDAISNTIVWWLSFAPFLGIVVASFLAKLDNSYNYNKYWFITLIINVVLSYADDRNLKKAGHDTSKLGSAFLVPIYLYKRAEMLKQSNTYFWIWIILFVLSLSNETYYFL